MSFHLLPFLLLLNSAVEVFCETCPAQEDISPCLCSYSGAKSEISVTCKGSTLLEIENAFKHLRGKEVKEMELRALKFERLPLLLFWKLHIGKLAIRDSGLQGISESDEQPAFVGLENSLEDLRIVASITGQNKLTNLNLSHLNKLKMLLIRYNNIPELGNDWFQNGPQNLTELNIEYNNIKVLGDRAFASLKKLRFLYFSNDSITTFKRTMLPNPARKLRILSLQNNAMSSFPVDAFSAMPLLQNVYLKGNSIRRLPSSVWSSIWERVYVIDLGNNPLECDSHIEWMFQKKIPRDLEGTCYLPDERKGKKLKEVIEANQQILSGENVSE